MQACQEFIILSNGVQQKERKQYNNNSGVDFFVKYLIIAAHQKKKNCNCYSRYRNHEKIETKFDQMLKRSLGKCTIFDMEQLQ